MSLLQKQLATANGRLIEIDDEMEAVATVAQTEGRDLNDEDNSRIQALTEELSKVKASRDSLQVAVETSNRIKQSRISSEQGSLIEQKPKAQAVPARAARTRSKVYKNNFDAYACGQWMMATFARNDSAAQFCREHGIGNNFKAAMSEGTDSAGGYSVPDIMASTIIELVESWGVYRQYSRNVTLTSDTLLVPKLAGNMTVVYPGEGNAITPSDLVFDQVQLVAVKMAALGIMSTELNEDSVISMVDLLTRDIARMFAYNEDLNGFLGDGIAAGGQTGISAALEDGAKIVQTGTAATAWAELTLANFQAAAGKIKEYGGIRPRWFVHRYGYYNSMINLLTSLGGTDMRQYEEGGEMMFLGYPVTFTQVLPGDTTAADDLLVVLGDLDLGTYLGTARNVSIRTLNELYAASDSIGVMGTLRSIVNVHDVGTSTEAGSIVGIYAAAA